ncbi:hypothetical protein DVH05_005661 [Phytophthora capsici]|nr:hypothetical protein DVH05_005661 [Phytophthora capsici]
MMRLVSPVKRSVEGIKAKLVTSGEAQQQLGAAIEKLTQRVDRLRQQSLNNNSAGQETHKVVASEAAEVKAALRRLQEKVETVEGSVKSCSSLILKAHQSEAAKQDTLLSAVAASSCKCVEDSMRAGDFPDTDRTMRKRQRGSSHDNAADGEQASYILFSPVQRPPTRARTQSPQHDAAGVTVSYGSDDDDIAGRSLNVSLKRIQNLLEKRREYLHKH